MMTTCQYNVARRKSLEAALHRTLTASQLTMIRELVRAQAPASPAPKAEDMLFWMRLNMPAAAGRVESVLHPCE